LIYVQAIKPFNRDICHYSVVGAELIITAIFACMFPFVINETGAVAILS